MSYVVDHYRDHIRPALRGVTPSAGAILERYRQKQRELADRGISIRSPHPDAQMARAEARSAQGRLALATRQALEDARQDLYRERRHMPPATNAELLVGPDVRGIIDRAVRDQVSAWSYLEPKIQAAIADGNVDFLRAVRRIAPMALENAGQPLMDPQVEMLDRVGGTADNAAAADALREITQGAAWLASALAFADAELEEVAPIPAVNLPMYDGGVLDLAATMPVHNDHERRTLAAMNARGGPVSPDGRRADLASRQVP